MPACERGTPLRPAARFHTCSASWPCESNAFLLRLRLSKNETPHSPEESYLGAVSSRCARVKPVLLPFINPSPCALLQRSPSCCCMPRQNFGQTCCHWRRPSRSRSLGRSGASEAERRHKLQGLACLAYARQAKRSFLDFTFAIQSISSTKMIVGKETKLN